MDFKTIVWLLPILFMIHDFEEIIFFKPWIHKNKDYIKTKYPLVANRMLPRLEKLSTQAFAVAVAEEFLLLSVITFTAVYFDFYLLWLGAFMGFSIHLIFHFLQWIFIKRYIPAIITSILILPYSVYSFIYIVDNAYFTYPQIAIWTILGIFLVGINLFFAHWLAEKFGNRKNKS